MMKRVTSFVCSVLLFLLAVLPVAAIGEVAVYIEAYRTAETVHVQLLNTERQDLAAVLPVELWGDGQPVQIQNTEPTGAVVFENVSVTAQIVQVKSQAYDTYATSGLIDVTDVRLSFTFTEGERTFANNKLSVVWNPSSNATIKAVFGANEFMPENASVSPAVFDVSSLLPVTPDTLTEYQVKYIVTEGPVSVTVDAAPLLLGTISTVITVEKGNDNTVKAILRDAKGRPIPNATLSFRLGSNPGKTATTDTQGECVFQSVYGADPKKTVVSFAGAMIGTVQYTASSQSLYTTTATTTTTSTTTTNSESDPTTTTTKQPSSPTTITTSGAQNTTATALGTTVIQQDKVVIGATYDTNTLSGFGISAAAMTSSARMLLSPSYYTQLAAYGMPLLSLRETNAVVTKQALWQASQSDAQLKDYAAKQIRLLGFDLQLVLISADGSATAQTLSETVTVRLPVPEQMKNAETVAVAMAGESMTPVVVPVKNGIMEFQIMVGASYVIVGYGEAPLQVGKGTEFPLGSLIALIGGLILLITAIILLYVFVIRRSRFGTDPHNDRFVPPLKKKDSEPNQEPISLPDLEEEKTEDPFRSQYVEKNSIVDDLPLLQREQAKKSKKATDYNVDL